jgi:hypothetical protein
MSSHLFQGDQITLLMGRERGIREDRRALQTPRILPSLPPWWGAQLITANGRERFLFPFWLQTVPPPFHLEPSEPDKGDLVTWT